MCALVSNTEWCIKLSIFVQGNVENVPSILSLDVNMPRRRVIKKESNKRRDLLIHPPTTTAFPVLDWNVMIVDTKNSRKSDA
jgi:hypothetical protein